MLKTFGALLLDATSTGVYRATRTTTDPHLGNTLRTCEPAILRRPFSQPSVVNAEKTSVWRGPRNVRYSQQNVDWNPLVCHRWRGNHERHNGTGLPCGQHDLSRIRSRDRTVRTGERPSGGARGEPRRPPPRATRLLHSCRVRDELSQRGLHEGTCFLFPRLSRTVLL